MHAPVLRQLRVKSGRQVTALLNQNRVAGVFGENMHPTPDTADDGGADEDRFELPGASAGEEFASRRHRTDGAIDLPSVGIAFDRDINQTETRLPRRGNVSRHQNRAGAGAEQGAPCSKPDKRIQQPFLVDELQHGRAFPARDDEPFDEVKLLRATDENGVGA